MISKLLDKTPGDIDFSPPLGSNLLKKRWRLNSHAICTSLCELEWTMQFHSIPAKIGLDQTDHE